ncbi:hypothetical protein [Sphingobacterium sp. WOUb80]|uniref:hypothetical protein n=1 Tax=Sphingobacterium sp. WOUb80 TaxID=3234028 RepID=UPI003CFA7750
MSRPWVRFLLDFFIFVDISPIGRFPCQSPGSHGFDHGVLSGTTNGALGFALLVFNQSDVSQA